ncbi:Zn(II)2Cys6 transcription factor [Aspergillus affinis]|uniref:Zn(II)2Cys6 transcription factor n=1 Tax=Aspergillus affinis TaxID=1070780 RepID=UPI0022FDDA6E|nr:uncharacterized protein KD926_002856 [Aspergillus affinis]KAI9035827.1 hypothetical protein KD926_002856 [Aspergillus affinis]
MTYRVRFEPVISFAGASTPTPVSAAPTQLTRSKSKLGCRQCKTKRVKCDETYPVCQRCIRQGLICSAPSRLTQWQLEIPWFLPTVDSVVHRRLFQYWLERVSQQLVIDPEDNPFSFPILEYIAESPALVHIIQSVSARHEVYYSAEATVTALEERGNALVSFRAELERSQTEPRASLLTAMLLALSHGADHDDMADYGKEHIFAAGILARRIVRDISQDSENDYMARLCFGMYLYMDMCSAFLVDSTEQPQRPYSLDVSIAVHKMGSWHHPMYGSCTELLYILANMGRYCRRALDSETHDRQQEGILEQQILGWDLSAANHSLRLLYESLRSHGLILLYRISGYHGQFINPGLADLPMEDLIHRDAIRTINQLLEIPNSSNYLNFQTLPMLTAASELGMNDGQLQDKVRQRFKAIYSLNRLPAILQAIDLLEELWTTRTYGDRSSWLDFMLKRGWRLQLG